MGRPTSTRTVNTEDFEVPQPAPRVLRSTGDASEALDPPVIEVVERPIDKALQEKIDILNFMEEEIEIEVADTDDPTAQPIPEVCNGGDRHRQYFIRGQVQKVKRKYVEVLARARRIKYSQEEFINNMGMKDYREHGHSVLAYPFRVVNDPNPKGAAWLAQILKEA